MNFCDRVKEVRGALTQKKFAEKLGVHTNTVSRWERGEQTPDQKDLCNILEIFKDVSPEWLLTGVGSKEKFDKTVQVSKNDTETIFRQQQPSSDEAILFDSLGMVEGMGLLTKIYSSADPVYIRAINANLMAFADAVENKIVAKDTEKRLQELEADLAQMKNYIIEMRRQAESRDQDRLGEQSSERKVA